MKLKFNHIYALALSLVLGGVSNDAFAGNPERQGQAGAAQLTINGWSRSSGMGWSNGGSVMGVEAMFMNVAGLDRMINRTELIFSRTEWLVGSGIGINNVGFAASLPGYNSVKVFAPLTADDKYFDRLKDGLQRLSM